MDELLIEEDENRQEEEQVPDDVEMVGSASVKSNLSIELSKLNPNQLAAVTHPIELGSLQILAGPGSGKTKVLVTRTVALIQRTGILPANLLLVTFTNKSANEMRKRLDALLGSDSTQQIVLGTFHSVCVRFLRKYHNLINLSPNFLIADRDDCLIVLKRAISTIIPTPDSNAREFYKPNLLLDKISKAKSLIITPTQYLLNAEAIKDDGKKAYAVTVGKIYQEYQAELKRDTAMDFDDLLVYGLELFSKFPRVIAHIECILIDEFQDTNSIQYEIVRAIAKKSGNGKESSVTIVGDPDQSIYSWRSAQVENLERMVQDFAPVTKVFLEENYRSTSSIIGASLLVIKEAVDRIPKTIKVAPSTVIGSPVVLAAHPNAVEEAHWIASQISLMIAHAGVIEYEDICILLRYGALSRVLEMALLAQQIPYKILGSHKFFARFEVKELLSFLQFIDNPSYTPAFSRLAENHLKGIGTTTQNKILSAAKKENSSIFDICCKIVNGGGIVSLNVNQRKGLKDFVESIKELRKAVVERKTVSELIDQICEAFHYQDLLKRLYGAEWEERWLNILELKSYATTIMEDHVTEDEPDVDCLRDFLANAQLSTDTDTNEKNNANIKKVSISTVHASKGLEFPVVFIPAVEATVYPFFRSTSAAEIEEERRLLFVAVTRAQLFCTISYALERMAGGDKKKVEISPFLKTISEKFPTVFVKKLQKITAKSRLEFAKILKRESLLSEEVTTSKIQAHDLIVDAQSAVLKAEADKIALENSKLDDLDEYGLDSSPNPVNRFSRPTPASTIPNYISSRPSVAQKWNQKSNSSASVASGAVATPPNSGFASALHVHRTLPPLPLPPASPPPESKKKSTKNAGQSLLSFARPVVKPSSSFSSSSTSRLPPPTTAPNSKIVETRVSKVGVSVLVNPTGQARVPSLESMVQNSKKEMEELKNLGKADVGVKKLNQPFKRPSSKLFEWDGKKKTKEK